MDLKNLIMKKLNFTLVIILGLCLAVSCNNQSKPQQTSQTETTNQQEDEVYLDDVDEYDDEVPEVDPNGYKWIEGVWAASDDYGNFARLIITDQYMQMVNSNRNDLSDKVEDQPKQEYSIEIRNNYILGKDILCMNDFVGVDVANHCPYVILGEYSILPLDKIEGETIESAIAKANQPDAKGIHGITDSPSYTWADENLYGCVQSYIEKVEKETHGGSGYCVTKKFDETGNIVYYRSDANWILGYGIYPKGEELPIGDKINFRGSQTQTPEGSPNDFILDHNLLNPAQIKIEKRKAKSGSTRLLDNVERTYKYDALGKITALYENNQLLYEFEYDTYDRLAKILENGKPCVKISWGYNYDPQHANYSIKFYSPEGYDDGEYKYVWKSNDVLASIWNDGEKELYYYPEFTFYDFPKVKMVTTGIADKYKTCYFYDEKGHLSHMVTSTNKKINANLYGTTDLYYKGVCKSYTYDDKGNVCSANTADIYWPWSHRDYDEFIKYVFTYNFNQLPKPKEETIWRYVYDDHGNWTKRERYEVIHGDIDIENLKDITIREYVYY